MFQILDAVDVDLAGRNEGANVIHFAFQAAFVVPGDAGLDDHALGDIAPIGGHDGRVGQRKLIQPFLAVKTRDDDLEDLPDLGRLGELSQRQHTLIAPAQLDEHVVVVNGENLCLMARLGFEIYLVR